MPSIELTVTYPYEGDRRDGETLIGIMLRELRLQFGERIQPVWASTRQPDQDPSLIRYNTDCIERLSQRRGKHDTASRDDPDPVHVAETVSVLGDPDKLVSNSNEEPYRRYRAEGRV